MTDFYVWISILINDYEPIISNTLLSMGYSVGPSGDQINNNGLLAYRISHVTKSISDVENDFRSIIDNNKLKCHSCTIIIPNKGVWTARWWGSNISFPPDDGKKVPTPDPISPTNDSSKEIEDVVSHLNRILDNGNSRIRESRNNL